MADVLTSYDLKGALAGGLIREEIMNKIWDISKIPLPFTDMIGSTTSKNEYTEWTTDELAAPDVTNAVGDGADATGNDVKLGVRVGNHHQISDKVVIVSHRADASDTIGRAKELAYQLMRRQQELKRDVEAISLYPQVSAADTSTASDDTGKEGKVGGLPTWIETNVSNGTGGGFDTSTKLTTLPTGVTAAALSETAVRAVIDSIYQQGGDPVYMMSVPGVIGAFAQYLFTSTANIATLMSDQGKSREKAAALSAVQVFITQHGTVRLVSNRLQQVYDAAGTDVADVFILDPEYLSMAYLEGYRTDTLAKTGLSNKRQMSVDWTLKVMNEKAQGIIFGIDPTLPAEA